MAYSIWDDGMVARDKIKGVVIVYDGRRATGREYTVYCTRCAAGSVVYDMFLETHFCCTV